MIAMKYNKLFLTGFLCFVFLIQITVNNRSYAQIRQEVSLNGTWDFKWDNENRLAYPPDDNGWETIDVMKISRTATGFGENGTNHWAWYKRKVNVPDAMKGQRIKIRFTKVKYKTLVYWNSEKQNREILLKKVYYICRRTSGWYDPF